MGSIAPLFWIHPCPQDTKDAPTRPLNANGPGTSRSAETVAAVTREVTDPSNKSTIDFKSRCCIHIGESVQPHSRGVRNDARIAAVGGPVIPPITVDLPLLGS